MRNTATMKTGIIAAIIAAMFATAAFASGFDIPAGDLESTLNAYSAQTGVQLIYAERIIKGIHSKGVRGELNADDALLRILAGTGLSVHRDSGVVAIVPGRTLQSSSIETSAMQLAAATVPVASGAALETVTVTSSKIGGDVQNIPISITALSQEQLTATQTAGGPDLVKQVPNLTFSKTNFTGYNIEIRGIGTQAISVTTDPAVAVAFNDIPFIRNHFFEQEFYDVSQVEVLRGPQGTLYGRNATAGVVNLISAKPSDQFEAMVSADIGNYQNRRFEGMVNIPIVDDRLDIRIAGEWTKRNGYTEDTTLNAPVDGRDLWSTRATVGWKPASNLQIYLVWEHFSEDDDRLRSGKALCTTDPGPSSVDGPTGPVTNIDVSGDAFLSQGCKPGSLYSPSAYALPNPGVIPFVQATEYVYQLMSPGFNPYGTLSQSTDLRVIGSALRPRYSAKNDTVEFNVDYAVAPSLTLTSQTGYNRDFLYSTEDYNRFNTVPDAFSNGVENNVGTDGQYCDPQLGCSTQFLAEDLSQEHAEQLYQEVRLASNYSGPLNFNAGANYLYYQTVEDYYVFSNLLSWFQENTNGYYPEGAVHYPFNAAGANACRPQASTPNFNFNGTILGTGCAYVDPNPLSQIDGQGHNYFRSQNPYRLNSFAGFGEAYYQLTSDVKLTAGLRWTDDMKNFTEIPSWTLLKGEGYPVTGVEKQQWKEWTGRFVANWTPKLDFTDQSLFYGSYSRGYKGGGANPPSVMPIIYLGKELNSPSSYTHPLTFNPEFVDAFEVGTKNTLLDGAMTLNGDVFYYKYQNYQISEIVDRTAVNSNFNATVKGAELESTWEPLPGLRFNFAGGWEDGTLDKGDQAIDLMDRTAGMPGWMVVRPFITQTSSCIFPTSVVNQLLSAERAKQGGNNSTSAATVYQDEGGTYGDGLYFRGDWNGLVDDCYNAYDLGVDPGTIFPFSNPTGFNPATAPNNGEGFTKDLSGNKLPNAPPFTLSLGAQYSMPLSADWVATARADGYWQGNSFARVFNDKPYDQIHGYTNLNLSLIFTSQNGWQAMAYVKNVFDVTAITGDFLNSDDTGLTTNVFLTDPRLFGVRVTKNF
jgi:iron complex outermembrane receptor protein